MYLLRPCACKGDGVHVRTLWDVGTYVPTMPMCM